MCICVNYVAALCFGSVTLVMPSPVEFSCAVSPRPIQTRTSFRDCSSGSSIVQPCRKLRHRLRFPRCPAAGAAALAAAAAAAAAVGAAAAGTAAAVALGAAQLAKHPRRHPLIGGSACHLNTNRGNFGMGYDVGRGGGVEPLGETSSLQPKILVPKNFSLERRAASKHSLDSWLPDFAHVERAATGDAVC